MFLDVVMRNLQCLDTIFTARGRLQEMMINIFQHAFAYPRDTSSKHLFSITRLGEDYGKLEPLFLASYLRNTQRLSARTYKETQVRLLDEKHSVRCLKKTKVVGRDLTDITESKGSCVLTFKQNTRQWSAGRVGNYLSRLKLQRGFGNRSR